MKSKFSTKVITLSDVKVNSGGVVNQLRETHGSVLLTNRDRGVAVVQDLDDDEKGQEASVFFKAVAQGLMDIDNGNCMELSEVKAKLGIR